MKYITIILWTLLFILLLSFWLPTPLLAKKEEVIKVLLSTILLAYGYDCYRVEKTKVR